MDYMAYIHTKNKPWIRFVGPGHPADQHVAGGSSSWDWSRTSKDTMSGQSQQGPAVDGWADGQLKRPDDPDGGRFSHGFWA